MDTFLRTLIFIGSSVLFGCYYYASSRLFATQKQQSWLITTLASFVMVVFSLPFVSVMDVSGSVKSSGYGTGPAVGACTFFQAYLAMDLLIGSMKYRPQIGLATGWIHHPLYICVVELAIRRSWAHIFLLGSIMELPTFILGLGTILPEFRANVLFAATFFLTRILFHMFLFISYLQSSNRAMSTGGSFVPAIIFAGTFPMHALWFHGCIKGFLSRRKSPAASSPSTAATQPVPLLALRLPLRGRYQHYRARISYRLRRLHRPYMHIHAIQRRAYAFLPCRKSVFDFVGLGVEPSRVGKKIL